MTEQKASAMKPSSVGPASRGSLPASGATGLTFKEILSILRRYMWLIIIITVLATCISGGLWFVLLRTHPRYTSVGYIRCRMPSPAGLDRNVIIPREDTISMLTASASTKLQSDFFLNRVLSRLTVQNTDWYQDRKNDPERRLEDMKKSFRAYPLRNQDLVGISMSDSDKSDAKTMVDEAMAEFANQETDIASADLRDRLGNLREQQAQVAQKLAANQEELVDMDREAGVSGWQRGTATVLLQELNLLHEEQLRLQAQVGEYQIYKQQLLQERQEYGSTGNTRVAIEQDPMVVGYRNQIAGLSQQQDVLIQRLGQSHRQVKAMETMVQSARENMAQRENQLRQQYGSMEMNNVDRQILSLMAQLDGMNQQYEETYRRQRDVDQKVMLYERRQEENQQLQARLQELERVIRDNQLKLKDPDRVTVEIYQRGSDPLKISFPMLKVFLPGGFVIGLILSLGLAFLIEFMDDSLKSPTDVLRYLHLPLLGMIPSHDQEEGESVRIETISWTHPQSLTGEFYRQLKTNLLFTAPKEQLKTILITSPAGQSGKTATAVNLAINLAGEGKKVLLIDTNFRRPALDKLFDSASSVSQGLSNILVGQVDPRQVICSTGIKGLDLVKTGPLPPNPADLLGSDQTRDFLQKQKQNYDFVILDGPPSLVVVDARILAEMVDGVIVVIHAEKTSRGMAQRMIREVGYGKARVFGVVLNAVRPRKGGYFQKAYKSYYQYVQAKSEKQKTT